MIKRVMHYNAILILVIPQPTTKILLQKQNGRILKEQKWVKLMPLIFYLDMILDKK